ncbi:hypothetical protein FZ103_17410 [Streptomonospora sp. PA3]|uniref:hypothetical protein n=1 Tax=Streptomonospora sp. PA3 TaxID=2607326 RepID=UPI0012DE9DE2|nr:hypothetical protein [Streptomonospora sp. PA3]MUL42923.1 hypothetical protein [Streptomonospora sp. PA3]
MNDVNQSSRRIALAAAAVIVIVLGAGFAVTRLTSGGAEPAAPGGADGGAAGQGGGAGGFDVTALLPDSEGELQEAAGVAREFATAYFGGGADRTARLEELAVPGYADALAQEGAAPPVQGEPVPPVATGGTEAEVRAEVTGIRDLAKGSVTYVVRADVAVPGGAEHRFEYAATLAEEGGDWRVSGFYDAALGDSGAR